MEIGENIKSLREERNYTQVEIYRLLNITPSTLSKYETGRCQPPLDFLMAYADIMNVSIDYILGKTKIKFDYSVFNKTYAKSVKTSTLINDLLTLNPKHRVFLIEFVDLLKCQSDVENISKHKV